MPKIGKKHIGAYIGVALFIAASASAYYVFPQPGPTDLSADNSKSFVSGRYGIAFRYPQSYALSQRELNTVDTISHEIMIAREQKPVPKDSEEPPFITVDIYENEPEYASAQDFIQNDRESNYQLSDGEIRPATYGSLSGYEYSWSGLYEGRSFVTTRKGFIYMFSVAGGNEDPGLKDDFERIMRTVSLAS